jgi:hypothetical protein
MGSVPGHVIGILVLSIFTITANAQVSNPSQSTRFTVGIAPMLSQPRNEFRSNIGNGFGGAGSILYRLDRQGIFSLRFDPSWVEYGHEKKRVPLSETVGGKILLDVKTTNSIASFSFGPEVALPRGPVRPYLSAAYSRLLFRTNTSVNGNGASEQPIAKTTNYSDGTGAWVFGGGIGIPLGGSDSHLSLDLGVRYHRGGQVSYLREGSIRDNPDGSISITPLTSRTPYMTYVIGVRFRIPYNSQTQCPRFLC